MSLEVLKPLSPPITGVELAPEVGLFGIYTPVASTNLIWWGNMLNPNVYPVSAIDFSVLELLAVNGRSGSALQWYADGAQLEKQDFPTSYIHPDYNTAY